MNINKKDLNEQGLSDKEIQEVLDYEQEMKADADLKEYDKKIQNLSEQIAKEKQIKLSEESEEMKTQQFLSTKVGSQIIDFIYTLVKSSNLDISSLLNTPTDLVSITELTDTSVELLFFDDKYRSGSFFFDFGALYEDNNEIKINYKIAFTQNLKYWAKKTRSLSWFNTMGDSHTDKLIYSDFWKTNKDSYLLQIRLRKYQSYAQEKRNYETIMEKMTPFLAKKIVLALKDDKGYKDIFIK